MPTVNENSLQWSVYDWPEGGDEWSKPWGGARMLWYGSIYPRLMHVTPAPHILEIAPGYGRCTQFLLPLCQQLSLVDVTEKCITACKARFSQQTHIRYHVNDGRSLAFLADASVDVVFSWDSLVHADMEVFRSYLAWLSTKLSPGGYGFLHHSNLGAHSGLPADNPSWRDRTMSAALFRTLCQDNGLWVLSQELIPWDGVPDSDVISVFQRPPHPAEGAPEPRMLTNADFPREVAYLRTLSELYNLGPRPAFPIFK